MKLGIDILGNIVLLKFDRSAKRFQKEKIAKKFLKEHKSVRTVLEKVGGFSGRLRTQKTKWVAGEKTKEALYKENGCEFRFNVDSCYFSGRLSEERKEIAGKVRKNENALVMFGGVGVYAIVIGKLSKAKRIISVELGRECNKYAKMNVKRNKLGRVVEIAQGDVRKVVPLFKARSFDRIIMPRPNLKDSFLDVAFPVLKKRGIIHYYGFVPSNHLRKSINGKTASYDNNWLRDKDKKDIREFRDLIKSEARKARRKIRILKIKKSGDIGPYRFRYRVDVRVL